MALRTHLTLRPAFRRFPLVRSSRPTLNQVAGVPIRHPNIMRFDGALNSVLHPSALTTLSVPFGALSRQRFDHLFSVFGSRSQVAFDPNRRYDLIDFLPPVIQAIVNLDLELPPPQTLEGTIGWSFREPENNMQIFLDANCHGTSWSLARACRTDARQMLLFFGDMAEMDRALEGERFDLIEELAVGQLNLLGVVPMAPGDIVAFHEVSEWPRVTMLLHTAVHVGAGLFIDKPNTELAGEDSPYRLGTAEMISTPLLHAIGPNVRADIWRARGPMKPATTVFRSSYVEHLKVLARSSGKPVGMPIVPQFEYGLGGGITNEAMCALATLPVDIGDDGRGRLTGIKVREMASR